MSMDNMQLKEESLLGGQEVLSDINPITNTLSIDDSASGEKLNITIARMWEAINNKLSRIVNSVNGRSGVVVLTSDDVGLGNVDNVSFYDIKQWVIDQIESVFGNKRLRLYETFQNAMDAKDSNDRALAWAPFYCDHYDNDDTRSVIGVFGWDSGSQTLTIDYRRINTIGFADNSIIYRTTPNDYGSEYGIPVGGIGVNIYNEEREEDQVLYVEGRNDSSVDKRSAGLRIDHDKLGSRVYYFDTPYGTYDPTGTPALPSPETGECMLWRNDQSADYQGYRVLIEIDGQLITPRYAIYNKHTYDDNFETVSDVPYFYIDKRWKHYVHFRNNDIIVSKFNNFIPSNQSINYGGICVDFSRCQPSIGFVTKCNEDQNADFIISFNTLAPNTNGYGINTLQSHQDRDTKSSQLGIYLSESLETVDGRFADKIGPGHSIYENAYNINVSGLNTSTLWESISGITGKEAAHKHSFSYSLNGMPYDIPSGGISIITDGTLAVYPRYQAYPTRHRIWNPPKWIENKFYEKTENDEYILTTSEPGNWYDGEFIHYYVRDPSDENTYIKITDAINPSYTQMNETTGKGDASKTYPDQCIGSLISTNYSFYRGGEHSGSKNAYSDDPESLNPRGLNESDGMGGIDSVIGINLCKTSFSKYVTNIGMSYIQRKAGYQFYNISGLGIKQFTSTKIDYTGNQQQLGYKRDFLEELGIPDCIDAYGRDLHDYRFPTDTTAGVIVNIGRFLEITPKTTYRAEKYWDGGKVQVRVGKGLAEQYEEIDITDIVKTNRVPSDFDFSIDYLKARYVTHTTEFYIRLSGDDDNPAANIQFIVQHIQLDEKPDDWDTNWFEYEYNIGTSEDPDYVFLPHNDDNVIGFNESDYNYMGPYYRIRRFCWLEEFPTFKELHDWYTSQDLGYNSHLIWKRPTNRITLDLDKKTLDFDERGKITVVGGTGGGNQQPGRNIRVVDTRGIYFDTMPYVIDSDTGLPKYPVEEVMSLGPGLKLTGAGVKVPITMKLWGYVKNAPVSSKRATYSTLLLEIWDNMSVGERATYFRKYCMDDNQGLGPIYIGNVLTYNGFKSFSDTVRNAVKLLPNTTTGYSQDDFDMDITQTAADFQEMITSQEVVAYNDASYNIPTYRYLKSDIRPYLSMSADDIHDMLENLLLGIETMYDGTDKPIPEDWDNKKIKILQYFADHYGMGTVSSLDHDVNMAMWNSKLPYINDQPHISTDPFPLDWAFSFFAQAVLVGGEWQRIVEGQYEWTAVTNRPGTWDAVITEDYTTNSLSYFFSADDNKKPNTELLIVPEYKPTAFWVIRDITLENGWKLEFDNLSGSTVSEWNTTYAQYAFMATFRKLEDPNAPGDWETNYSKYFTINRLSHGSDPIEGSPLLLKHVESDTTPTYAPNVYYVQDNAGTIKAWVRIDRRVAYNSDEIGTAANPVKYAPTFETNKYYKKITAEGADPTYQLLEAKPDDWYTNFMSYFTKYDVTESESTYDPVVGSVTTVYASITAPGNYWTRSLVPTT